MLNSELLTVDELGIDRGYLQEKTAFFAEKTALFEVSYKQFSSVISECPIAFKQVNNEFGAFAIMGMSHNENCFVDTSGSWNCEFTPVAMKVYPFCTDVGNDLDELKLKIYKAGVRKITNDNAHEVHSIKNDNSNFAVELVDVIDSITNFKKEVLATRRVVKLFDELNLLEPWNITFRYGEHEKVLGDVYKINEAALMALEVSQLSELLRKGIVGVAYAQILSQGRIERIAKIVERKLKSESYREKFITGETDTSDVSVDFDF